MPVSVEGRHGVEDSTHSAHDSRSRRCGREGVVWVQQSGGLDVNAQRGRACQSPKTPALEGVISEPISLSSISRRTQGRWSHEHHRDLADALEQQNQCAQSRERANAMNLNQ